MDSRSKKKQTTMQANERGVRLVGAIGLLNHELRCEDICLSRFIVILPIPVNLHVSATAIIRDQERCYVVEGVE
jgi:hypothetical protein